MIRLIISGFLLLAFIQSGAGQDAGLSQPLIKARYLVTEQAYTDALTILENERASGPDAGRHALAMGEALAGLQQYAGSNGWLSQVTGDGSAEASFRMAKNFLALKDYPAAMEALGKHLADPNHYPKKLILRDPDFSALDSNREWIRLWQNDWYTDAEQQAAECEYLLSQGQIDDAQALIGQTLGQYPKDPAVRFLNSRIHFLLREDRLFREEFDLAWKLAAGLIVLQNQMLAFAMENNLYEKANELSGLLIRQDPTNPEYLIDRALVRIMDGKESQAMREIQATADAGIAPAELYYQAGRKFLNSKPIEAENFLNRAIESGIMDARFYHARGTVRVELDKGGLALEDFGMSLDIDAHQPDVYFERAQVRYDRGDTEGSCHDWRKALEMGNAKASDLLYKYCRLP